MNFPFKSRIDGRFVGRVGAALTTLVISLSMGHSILAQDADSSDALTPEGLIAFVADGNTGSDIYVMKADGTQLKRLTENGGYNPAWSPDGRRIAFMSDQDGNKEIYVMDADGRHVTRLTNNWGDDGYPTWSPDGQQIVFLSYSADQPLSLGDNLPVVPAMYASNPTENPSHLYIMNADGSNATPLENDPAWEDYPSWGPEGHSISFNSTEGLRWDVNIHLCECVQNQSRFYWSLNNTRKLFASQTMDGHWNLYTMSTEDIGLHNLTSQIEDSYIVFGQTRLSWSPDGETLVFAQSGSIYTMNMDGTDKRRLTFNLSNAASPVWQPTP